MAKKIRFPLQMNGTDVRTIEELRENFDLESVLGYFANGKLVTWLRNRYYDNEAMAVEALSANDSELNQKLMSILGVSADENAEEIDVRTIQKRNEKLMLLRQITDDQEIIENVDCVAFHQEELNQLLKEGKKKIYLCQGEFTIPICEADVTYTGISNPIVSIVVDDGSNMKLGNVILNNIKCTSDSSDILLQLGMCYKNGDGVEKNDTKAIEYLKRAAELGNAEAQCELGLFYEKGKVVEQSLEKAVEWYRKAAEQGHVDSQYTLGYYYRYGRGVEQSDEKAKEWWRKAAEQGDALAQAEFYFYYNYNGIQSQEKAAVECFRKAAEQGHASAQYDLGLCYEKGKVIEQSLEKAAEWYRKAAEQGNAEAQNTLGFCYRNGHGVEQSWEKAVEWWHKAAEQGHASAQTEVAEYYETKQSWEKAVEWYRKSAEQGRVSAQWHLGVCYENGRGVEQNLETAVEWYRKAAVQGYSYAQGRLQSLRETW